MTPNKSALATRRQTASETLAQWVVECSYDTVPTVVRDAARKALMNSLGTAVGGFRIDSTQRAIRYAKKQGRRGKCTILVDGSQLSASMAAFANGVMVNALGQEETHVASSTHPAQTTVPTVLALGESLNKSGQEVLEALIAGMQVTTAIGCMKLTPPIKLDKCHAPAVFGTIGAAAAAAKLVGLDTAETAHALGLAANFAAGFSEGSRAGTGDYHYLKGLVGLHALMAVDLAADGAVAAPQAFEGAGGFYHTFAGVPREELASFDVAADLRSRLEDGWTIPDLMYKPYPANFFNIPFVDAARSIRHEHDVRPEDIRAVRVEISEYAANSGGILRPPFTHRGNALASTAFCVSCMLTRGHLLPPDTFDIEAADIVEMSERVEVEIAHDSSGGLLEVATSEGTVSVPLGDRLLDFCLSESEVREISRTASTAVLAQEQVDELLSRLDELETADSLHAVIQSAVRQTRHSVKKQKEELSR